MATDYPPGLIESLQAALEAVVPPDVDHATVKNDTFGDAEIPLWTGGVG